MFKFKLSGPGYTRNLGLVELWSASGNGNDLQTGLVSMYVHRGECNNLRQPP